MTQRPSRKRLRHAITRPPFRDEHGRKGWLEPFSRAQPHVLHRIALTLPGWPHWPRPLRLAFLSDLHTGSHAQDVARFAAIVAELQSLTPDLVLFGGDYVNMQPLGGGRVPPHVTAAIMARIEAPCGRFAVLGNHDIAYGEEEVSAALREQGITVLDNEQTSVRFHSYDIKIVGLSDARVEQPQALSALEDLPPDAPAIVLCHDPFWFARVASQSHLTLAGHTHGGQIRLPFWGAIINQSKAPLRWSLGLVVEEGRHLVVSGGLGTSGVPIRIGVPPDYVVLDVNGPAA